MAVAGPYYAVGARWADDLRGAVYVYKRLPTLAEQPPRLELLTRFQGADNVRRFGWRVALSGSTLAVSGTGDASARARGEAYVFGLQSPGADLTDNLRISTPATAESFGSVGDVAITKGPDHYTVATDGERQPDVVIHPGQRCCSLDGDPLEDELMHGVRTWGNDPDGSTVMLVGAYESLGDLSDRLLRALPHLLRLSREEWETPLFGMLCDEVVQERPGQAAVLDRLVDLLLMHVLQAWLARPEAKEPSWYRHRSDPVVARALELIHGNPARPWTVADLAREAHVSRATLARRFHEVVGEPPMSFLTEWRLALAADLLCDADATVGTVAPRVGFSSPYALSTAFKRVRGESPSEHRARALAAAG